MDISKYRKDALERLESFKQRFEGKSDDFPPIKFARLWFEAFDKNELNINEIASIMREAEEHQDRYDILFHMFCNDMKEIYRSLWNDFLNS